MHNPWTFLRTYILAPPLWIVLGISTQEITWLSHDYSPHRSNSATLATWSSGFMTRPAHKTYTIFILTVQQYWMGIATWVGYRSLNPPRLQMYTDISDVKNAWNLCRTAERFAIDSQTSRTSSTYLHTKNCVTISRFLLLPVLGARKNSILFLPAMNIL
jgi:hypothetical protein